MKFFVFIICFLILPEFFESNNRIDEFLQKIEVLIVEEGFNHVEWEISKFYPIKNSVNYSMKYTHGQIYFHPILKVHYAFTEGKIFDPELNIGLNTKTAVIKDFTSGKEYPLSDFKKEEFGFIPKFILP